MRRLLGAFLCLSALLSAASFKLYLKDGEYQTIREYRVTQDRVAFYSIERGAWEEMPSALVDFNRTEEERASQAAAVAKQTRVLSEEDQAVRAQEAEVLKIPQDPGVYMLEDGTTLRIFKAAESVYHTNKGRSILKVLAPVPLIAGKGTVEVAETHSMNIVKEGRPDLYLQLSEEERFGLIKLTPKGQVRIAQRVAVIPVTNEAIEEMDQVELFRKQLTESGLYKIWPKEPLSPGEYAVIQYTPGKLNAQLWDFAVKP